MGGELVSAFVLVKRGGSGAYLDGLPDVSLEPSAFSVQNLDVVCVKFMLVEIHVMTNWG